MQFLFKNLSKYIAIPLLKEFASWLFKKFEEWQIERQAKKEVERKNEETRSKVEAYENSDPSDAFDVHP